MRRIRKTFLSLALLLVCSSCVVIDYMSGEREANRIREVGQKAEALIVEISDTGITVNNDPIVAFKLLIRPLGGDSYQVDTQGLVSRLDVGQIQPGAVIPVAIDPADKLKVAIDIYERSED